MLPAPCLQGMSHPVACFCPIAHFLKILWQVKETAPKAAQPRAQVIPRPPTPLFSAWPSALWVPEFPRANSWSTEGSEQIRSCRAGRVLSCWVDEFLELTWCTVHCLLWIIYLCSQKIKKKQQKNTHMACHPFPAVPSPFISQCNFPLVNPSWLKGISSVC